MATDHIRYDLLARDALRGVLRRVLDRRRRARAAGRASFLHHLPVEGRRREDVAPPSGATSGGNDGHSPAPVLGSDGDRGPLRGRPVVWRRSRASCGSLQLDQELLRSVGTVRSAVRAGRDRDDRGAVPATPAPSRRRSRRPACAAPVPENQDEPKPGEGAEVVRLDRFRKK